MKSMYVILFPALLLLGSCYFDKEETLYPSGNCVTTAIRYSETIKPIMDENCSIPGCHNATTIAGGYDFTGYNDLKRSAGNGSLLGSITHDAGFALMPEGRPKLSDCKISQIRSWIDGGALNN